MSLHPHNEPQYQWQVSWKKPRLFPQEIYDHLSYFVLKNPAYREEALLKVMKAKGQYIFEDDEVVIKQIPFQLKGIPGERPLLRDTFFWDIDIAQTDWNESYRYVIARVLARGEAEDWEELVRFYGRDTVLNVFRNQSMTYWPEGVEDPAREYFGLQPEDLVIYHRRLERPQYNIWKKD